jgi:hypothetical protein
MQVEIRAQVMRHHFDKAARRIRYFAHGFLALEEPGQPGDGRFFQAILSA